MTQRVTGTIHLVALNCGLPRSAEPLDCSDLRGPRSLLGESSKMPRPIGDWVPSRNCDRERSFRDSAYKECSVLWLDTEESGPAQRAQRIVEEDLFRGLSVPAATFLAGKCTSSFALAWGLEEDGLLPPWGSVICSCQTEGRGQLRRKWHSPRGNLYVSFRLPCDPLLQGDAASLVAGYIMLSAFRALGFPVTLKWPNDLLLNESEKIGGILLEEKNGVIVAGLGVNLYEAPGTDCLRADRATKAGVLLPESSENLPVSWQEERLEPFAPFPFWRRLVSEAILAYSHSVAGRGTHDVFHDMEDILAWKEREVIITEDESILHGRFLGLGPGGGLLLRLGPGERREFFSGSLSLVK